MGRFPRDGSSPFRRIAILRRSILGRERAARPGRDGAGRVDTRHWAAPDKVERVLHNLLTNALRHTPNDGSIAVVLTPGAGELTIAVEDTGEGLSDATAERMFEQFWRGERSRTSIGSGLGLAIASRLVELQGGRIWAESRTAGGARIAFTLPTAP